MLVAAGLVRAATFSESFATDPLARGWRVVGQTNLFRWNAAHQNMDVTWDSSRPNSFFQFPLGTILSSNDDFSVAFDLKMTDITMGSTSNKPYTFQIALGLVNSVTATNPNAFRGSGQNATYGVRNTVEFDYFPDSGFGATFAPTMISSNNRVAFSDNHPLELTTGDLFRITMTYSASNQLLKTTVLRNGAAYGLTPSNTLRDLALGSYPDFRANAFAIISWSDAIQTGPAQFWGSILAHGTVDNLLITVPDCPVTNFVLAETNSYWRGTFNSRLAWSYTLERTEDFAVWRSVSVPKRGTAAMLFLDDTNISGARAFYRVNATKP